MIDFLKNYQIDFINIFPMLVHSCDTNGVILKTGDFDIVV
jgi:hypothetical protein